MMQGSEERFEVRDSTYVEVEVIHRSGVLWDGKKYALGERFNMKHAQAMAAAKASQVKIVAYLPGHDPNAPGDPEPLATEE